MADIGVLLKHAESVTGTGLRMKEKFEEAELPKDLVRVLVTDHDQSDTIIEYDLARSMTFTVSPDDLPL